MTGKETHSFCGLSTFPTVSTGLYMLRRFAPSYGSLRHIGGSGLASQALICRRQRRKHPERYVQYALNFL
jgi:hypothetical protein